MNYVVFDLEWNMPITRYRKVQNDVKLNAEIVQIGAVMVNEKLEIQDKYNAIVKPQVYPKMLKEITELTDISDEVARRGRPFEVVVKEFLEWCGDDYVFLSWSPNDIYQLEDNMLFYGFDIEDLPECYDMQVMFDDQITMEGRDFALSYAMWKFDIKPELSHDALNDAMNTVKVMRYLDFSQGIEEYVI